MRISNTTIIGRFFLTGLLSIGVAHWAMAQKTISGVTQGWKVQADGKNVNVSKERTGDVNPGQTIVLTPPDARLVKSVRAVKYTPEVLVSLNETNVDLLVGETATLKATISPGDTQNKTVTWESANPSVATVNQRSGQITAFKVGTTTITASVGNAKESCMLTVFQKTILEPLFADGAKLEVHFQYDGDNVLKFTNHGGTLLYDVDSGQGTLGFDLNTQHKLGNGRITAIMEYGKLVLRAEDNARWNAVLLEFSLFRNNYTQECYAYGESVSCSLTSFIVNGTDMLSQFQLTTK